MKETTAIVVHRYFVLLVALLADFIPLPLPTIEVFETAARLVGCVR